MPTLHDASQSESHLEHAHLDQPYGLPVPPEAAVQRKRMLIALGILLVALAAVILRDWDFWFPSNGETAVTAVRMWKSVMPQETPTPAPAAPEKRVAKSIAPTPIPDQPTSATTQRAVLPPLEVEVVSGNRRINVPAGSAAIRVDPGAGPSIATGTTTARSAVPAASGPGRVELSPQTAQSVSLSVPPDYPLLARQMKVQGAVSLRVLIARDGTIQELEILSGPDILAAAAREAVKQWHFKPYLQNGQPVETQARITVNFTISTN